MHTTTKSAVAVSAFAAIAAVALLHAAPVKAASNPIKIIHCFVTVPKAFSKVASGTQIVYTNIGPKTAKKVTFGVGYRNAENHFYRKVTDVGSFAPGDQIDHHFSLYNDVTYAGKETSSCSALSVVWSDGTTWTQ